MPIPHSSSDVTPDSAAAVFARAWEAIRRGQLDGLLACCAETVVFEFPFAPAARPRRIEGKAAVELYLAPIFANTRIEATSEPAVHQSLDPAIAVVEYTASVRLGRSAPKAAGYIVVLRVVDGLIAEYRDYWDPSALTGTGS